MLIADSVEMLLDPTRQDKITKRSLLIRQAKLVLIRLDSNDNSPRPFLIPKKFNMEIENVATKPVESLRDLALKRSIISLKSSVDQLGKKNSNPIHPHLRISDLYWSTIQEVKEFILNSSDVQALIEFHKPHREYLSSLKMIDYYRRLPNGALFNLNDYFDGMMFWLCFENSKSTQLRFIPDISAKDRIIFSYIEKNNIKFSNCKILALETNFDDVDNSILTSDIFARIPKVEDLRLQVYAKSKSAQNLREQLMAEIISHCQLLKALKIWLYDDSQVREFCHFIAKSSNQIEQMEIIFPGKDSDNHKKYSNIHGMRYFLESLLNLQTLKMLNLDLTCVQFSKQDLETAFIEDKIESVKKMKIWIQDLRLLKLLDQCFNDIQVLAISCHPICALMKREMTNLQRITLENSLLSTSVFQNVTTLLISHVEVLALRMVTIWKIFPNLKEFTTFTLIIEDEDFNEFPVADRLEKLTVYFGQISPKLFGKMPNLKHFTLHQEMPDLPGLVNNIKPFLPPNCKLSTTKIWEIFRHDRGARLPIETVRM